uniref:Uncharacterized protein n=1 Tax=Papilio xuthus TaxID=66420 RepID=I4DKK7_PAPXU|nr:unknown unsecreted protein [Papilio xuthus]
MQSSDTELRWITTSTIKDEGSCRTVIVESAKPLDIPIQTKDQANSAALQAPPSAQTQPAVNNNLNVNLGDVNLNSIGRSDNKNYGEFSQNLQKVPLSGS